jgi:penicillin-binding protein 1A
MANGFTPKTIVQDAPICIGDWCPKNFSGGFSGPIPITTALVKSINVIPVRLAQAVGRDKIVETARKMGITSELRITRSLPLGSSEVTVVEMAGAYAAFANGGYKAVPYSFTQIHSGTGELLYDRKRDVPPPERVLDPKVVADMNGMLVQVPEWGTGVRAKLDGIRTAGKTGTTSAYRDAWFVGFTGNFAGAVWFGNDGYEPTRRLTGGIVPAQTWKQFMTFAHKGVELKPIPYIDNPMEKPADNAAKVAAAPGEPTPSDDTPKPITLSAESTARLVQIEALMTRAAGLKPVAAMTPPEATPPPTPVAVTR